MDQDAGRRHRRRRSQPKLAGDDPSFVKAFSRALAFIPNNPRFSCDNCLDRGMAFIDVDVDGQNYRIPYYCAEPYRTKRGKCSIANKTVLALKSEGVRSQGGSPHEDKGGKPWEKKDDDDGDTIRDSTIRVSLSKILPSKVEAERSARTYISELSPDEKTEVFRKPTSLQEAEEILAELEGTVDLDDQLGAVAALAKALQERGK